MRNTYLKYFLPLLAIAADQNNGNIKKPLDDTTYVKRPLTQKEKKERHEMYSGDQTQQSYVICGKCIHAPNKKVAKKIYSRLYGSK